MNATRAFGTGTVRKYGRGRGDRWAFRPPGAPWERGGYTTREAAELALTDYLTTGKDPRRKPWIADELNRTLAHARHLAGKLGLTLEAAMLSLPRAPTPRGEAR